MTQFCKDKFLVLIWRLLAAGYYKLTKLRISSIDTMKKKGFANSAHSIHWSLRGMQTIVLEKEMANTLGHFIRTGKIQGHITWIQSNVVTQLVSFPRECQKIVLINRKYHSKKYNHHDNKQQLLQVMARLLPSNVGERVLTPTSNLNKYSGPTFCWDWSMFRCNKRKKHPQWLL